MQAQMVELVDTPGLGPGAFGREGSSPSLSTNLIIFYFAAVVELVDTLDSKSNASNSVRVQVPPAAPLQDIS